jgi:diadenosine tetraphosphatase ApaH/serine/threonine PP2A family protein phosphatase
MRYGVISDVHANLPALEATLQRLDELAIDRLVCAGDIVGYGPHPNECITLLRRRGAISVAGNHDLMAVGRLGEERARRRARNSATWTRGRLDLAARSYLAELPLTAEVDGRVLLAHGSLHDPDERIRESTAARTELQRLASSRPHIRVLVVGNTHHQLVVDGRGRRLVPPGARAQIHADERYLMNPGSVGQSRESAPLARAALLDTAEGWVELLAVTYDIDRVRTDLIAAGLPAGNYHRPEVSPLFRLPRRIVRRVRRHLRT